MCGEGHRCLCIFYVSRMEIFVNEAVSVSVLGVVSRRICMDMLADLCLVVVREGDVVLLSYCVCVCEHARPYTGPCVPNRERVKFCTRMCMQGYLHTPRRKFQTST